MFKKLLILLVFMISSNAMAIDDKDYIPPQAFKYKEMLKTEIDNYFPNIPEYNYVPSLAEHESCIYLKHPKCWNTFSRLKSPREEGAGIFQITRAYRKDGSLRFDSLQGMKNQYKEQLKEASWSNIYEKPEIQMRIATLMLNDIYKKLYNVKSLIQRLKMTDAAYNGGLSDLNKERRLCSLSANCDPGIWDKNVETHCIKSKEVLYGKRSACDINRFHVKDVFENRLPKYKRYYYKES